MPNVGNPAVGSFTNANGQTVMYDYQGNQWYATPSEIAELEANAAANAEIEAGLTGGQELVENTLGESGVSNGFDWANSGIEDFFVGTSGGTNYGAVDPASQYAGIFDYWYQPLGGSTYIGVRADGSKVVISQAQAVDMGAQIPDVVQNFGQENETTVPGTPIDTIVDTGGNTVPAPVFPDPDDELPLYPDPDDELPLNPDPDDDPPYIYEPDPPYVDDPDTPEPPDEAETVPWTPDLSEPGAQTWNWDYFVPKEQGDSGWGGYDVDYGTFERYQPGMQSPWGMPDIEGGNLNFYQQQFNNLLRDEQGYRTRQRAAQLRAQEAAEAPPSSINYDDMWDSMGITPNQPGGVAPEVSWDLNSNFVPGESTNADILRWGANNESFSEQQRKWYAKLLADSGDEFESTSWAGAGDPATLIGWLTNDSTQLTPQNQAYMTQLFNTLYNPGQVGPYAPEGYVSPI